MSLPPDDHDERPARPRTSTPRSSTPRSSTPRSSTPRSSTPREPRPRTSSTRVPSPRPARTSSTRTRAASTPSASAARTSAARTRASAAGARGVELGRPLVRMRSGLVIVFVLLSLIGGRLVWLQGVQGPDFAEAAVEQRTRTIDLAAARGEITDRTGQALALSVDSRAVYAEPRNIARALCRPESTRPCTPPAMAEALALLLDLPADEIEARLTRRASEGKTCSPADPMGCTAFVYLARGLEADVANEVRDLGLVGIGTDAEPKRVAPGGDLAANVIGFTTVEGAGAAGLELQWDEVLAGRPGKRVAEVDGGGRVIPSGNVTTVEPQPGQDLQLTIDRDLQWFAQKALMDQLERSDAESGSATVIDVTTGEVLALASVPTFDANAPAEADEAVRGNRAVTDVFEPGSIGKAITVAAVLEEGVMTPDSVMTVADTYRLSNKTFKDSHPHPTERMTLTGVLVESSNVGTIMAAEKVGGAKLHEMLTRFGIGEKTGIGLPGESRGILRDEDTEWSGTDYGTHPIGQGYSVNGVQMASVYATIANDGVRVTPTIVKSTRSGDGEPVPVQAPHSERVISSKVAAQLRTMLEGVTNEGGTAQVAAIDGYRVAGKTGTAQRVVGGRYDGSYTASFVGFAPADAPRLAISVSIQAPKNGFYGGAVAGPVFQDIMGFALRSLRVPPTGAVSPVLTLREQ